jgi:gas vesicle protein
MKKQNHEVEHLENEQETRAAKPVLSGLIVGGLVGAAAMLLYAPKSGQETRAEIRQKTAELRDRTTETVKDTVSQVKSKAYQIKDDVVGKAEGLKHQGQEFVAKQLDRVSQTAESGKGTVQEY